ncbi:MAG: hypothetical protein GY937_12255 [bacterium]|nr:hypothetical protein [bacterium]
MKHYLEQVLEILGADRRRLPWIALLVLFASLADMVGIGVVGAFVGVVLDPTLLEGNRTARLIARSLGSETHERTVLLLGLGLVALFSAKSALALGLQLTLARFARNQQVRLRRGCPVRC